MNICKIWDSEYPWDVRAAKVAQSLTESGHTVHMVARNRDDRPEQEELEECTVHRLRYWSGVGRRLNAASMFPAFFNPRWHRLIDRTTVSTGADVLLCRDLPLLPTAIRVGRRREIPVVLDMAENYPAMIRGLWENGTQRWSDWLVRNPRAVEWVERWGIKRADHILVVVEESGERLVSLGVPESRITVVGNTPPLSRLETIPQQRSSGGGEALSLVYLGLLEAPRGIGTLIRAVGMCISRGIQLRLTLIGDGRDRAVFERLAAEVDPHGEAIEFLGYLPNAEALDRVAQADVGIIPHHADEAWNSTIPNKLFDYMAAGLPVVASNAIPTERVVRDTGSGRIFRDRDPEDLARALVEVSDLQKRTSFGNAGRIAIQEKYNWDADSARLEEALRRVTNQPGAAGPPSTSDSPLAQENVVAAE